MVECEYGLLVEWNQQGRTKVRVRVPVLLCPPQIPHELAWDRTMASMVRGQRLTAWAMSLPYNNVVTVVIVVAAAAAAALNNRSIYYFKQIGNRELQKFTYRFVVSLCAPICMQ